jgi:hypothetical protein
VNRVDVREAITQAHHEEWARVVAAPTRRFDDLDTAEEAAAEAAAYAILAARAAAPEAESDAAGRLECRWQRDQLPEAIRELVLDDQRFRNDICWSMFDCCAGRRGAASPPRRSSESAAERALRNVTTSGPIRRRVVPMSRATAVVGRGVPAAEPGSLASGCDHLRG